MVKRRTEPERIAILVEHRLLKRIDEYRWRARLASRAAAMRALWEIGLKQVETPSQKDDPPS